MEYPIPQGSRPPGCPRYYEGWKRPPSGTPYIITDAGEAAEQCAIVDRAIEAGVCDYTERDECCNYYDEITTRLSLLSVATCHSPNSWTTCGRCGCDLPPGTPHYTVCWPERSSRGHHLCDDCHQRVVAGRALRHPISQVGCYWSYVGRKEEEIEEQQRRQAKYEAESGEE